MLAFDMLNFLDGSTMVSFDAAASSFAADTDDCDDSATAELAVLLTDVKPDELALLAGDV